MKKLSTVLLVGLTTRNLLYETVVRATRPRVRVVHLENTREIPIDESRVRYHRSPVSRSRRVADGGGRRATFYVGNAHGLRRARDVVFVARRLRVTATSDRFL